jgi:nucleoside-diphosphate-sugar epimerase
MRVLVAGGSGVLGRRLVPQLVARGHRVTATTTNAAKLGLVEQLGADGVVMDGLDAVSVGEAVAAARPDAIVHQMTALSAAHAGKPDLKHPDRFFATTVRLRTEGTDHLLAAAEATGVSHVAAQGFGAFNGIREGGWVKTEEDLVDPGLASARERAEALRHLEDVVVKAGGAVLRYGSLYGPGAIDDWAGSCASGSSRWSGRHRLHIVGASRRRGPAPPCPRPAFAGSSGHPATADRPRRAPDPPQTSPRRAHTRIPNHRLIAHAARRTSRSPRTIVYSSPTGHQEASAQDARRRIIAFFDAQLKT